MTSKKNDASFLPTQTYHRDLMPWLYIGVSRLLTLNTNAINKWLQLK